MLKGHPGGAQHAALLLLLLGVFSSCSDQRRNAAVPAPPIGATLFTLLPSSYTGVRFTNHLDDTRELNVFTYRNYYNGGGVAIGDLTGDGLPEIVLTSNQDGPKLYLNQGQFRFRDVTGDVKGSSMGGEVRFQRVYRRDGSVASPGGVEDVPGLTDGTVQISTMGGAIDVDEAPEGVAVHTMGGDIVIAEARRFAKVTTMGGDIHIEAVDGWVAATTMGGDVEVRVDGAGGDVDLRSNSGNITLVVPSGFSMNLATGDAADRRTRPDVSR